MSAHARRVVLVSARYPFGSQEAFLSTELSELAPHFERVAVMPVRPPANLRRHAVPPAVEILPWPLVNLNLLGRAARMLIKRPRRSVRAIAQILRSSDPGRLKNLSVALKALALADWVTENGFDHIHAYWMSTPATVAMLAASVSDVTWSSTAHRWDIYERNAFDQKAGSVSFVRTISARGSKDLATRMPSLNGRIMELRLGSALLVEPAPAYFDKATFHIVCPAALVPVKGHSDLFAALKELRDLGVPVRCTLCGTGPLQAQLQADATGLGLEGIVEFAGFVPQATLHQWYRDRRFAAVVLASLNTDERMMEGIPSALIEAMSFGLPVVATNSGSVGELVNRRCGYVVEAGDPRDLARALFQVYFNPDAAHARAQRARTMVWERHNPSQQMQILAAAMVRKD